MKKTMILFVISCFILQTYCHAVEEKGIINGTVSGIQPAVYVTIGDKQYYISSSGLRVDYIAAMTFCNDDGMRLVSFDVEEKMMLIYDYLNNNGYGSNSYWTSGEKFYTTWRWTGTGQSPFKFTDWAIGQPDNAGDNVCVYFIADQGWFDHSFSEVHNFICEY